MGYDLFAFTQSPIDDNAAFVQLRPWKKEGTGWVCRAKNWQVVISASESLEGLDIGPVVTELTRVRPEVRYRTEINVEGRQSSEAIIIATASAQKAAFNLCGVVYDPQLDVLMLPISAGQLSAVQSGAP